MRAQAVLASMRAQAGVVAPVRPSQITWLATPSDLYDAIMQGITTSRHRVWVASLYLGTHGTRELALADALGEAASKPGGPRVTLLLDALRGVRPTNGRGEAPHSSAHVVARRVLRGGDIGTRARAFLYKVPTARGLAARALPNRLVEVLGVSHLKVCVFDDDILVTGANLSEEYFWFRQDRSVCVSSAPRLANEVTRLLEAVTARAYQLAPSLSLVPPATSLPLGDDVDAHARDDLTCDVDVDVDDDDVFIAPTLQLGSDGLRQDERTLSAVLDAAAPLDVTIASAYLNLAPPYARMLSECARELDVITAHPSCSGFRDARGFASSYIPEAYDVLGRESVASLDARLLHYNRPGWIFHGKGMWAHASDGSGLSLTSAGSSNWNQRSLSRDLEMQMLMVSSSSTFAASLHAEVAHLAKHAAVVEPTRGLNVPYVRRMAYGAIRSWL